MLQSARDDHCAGKYFVMAGLTRPVQSSENRWRLSAEVRTASQWPAKLGASPANRGVRDHQLMIRYAGTCEQTLVPPGHVVPVARLIATRELGTQAHGQGREQELVHPREYLPFVLKIGSSSYRRQAQPTRQKR